MDELLTEWQRLDALRDTPDECPASAFTVPEYCAHYSVCDATARTQIAKLVRSGKLRQGRRWGEASNGRRQLVTCYWVP